MSYSDLIPSDRRVLTTLMALAVGLTVAGCFAAPAVLQAAFACSSECCLPTETVSFDASCCTPGDSAIADYRWEFGDGAIGSGREVDHSYVEPGVYEVCLTIVAEDGQRASTTRDIEVEDVLLVPDMHATIQEAIDAAVDGDEIVVRPGTYQVALAIRKRITLRSSDPEDPAIVAGTVLRPKPDTGRPIVSFGDSCTATLDGFTITGLVGCVECASGAIYIREAAPIIRRNRIVGNVEGGIVAVEASGAIVDNYFSQNTCSPKGISGGAIHIYGCNRAPTLQSNRFESNTARSGGAIYVSAACADLTHECAYPVALENNTFENNTATEFGGGAVFVEFGGTLDFGAADSNSYVGNEPNDIFYMTPPS